MVKKARKISKKSKNRTEIKSKIKPSKKKKVKKLKKIQTKSPKLPLNPLKPKKPNSAKLQNEKNLSSNNKESKKPAKSKNSNLVNKILFIFILAVLVFAIYISTLFIFEADTVSQFNILNSNSQNNNDLPVLTFSKIESNFNADAKLNLDLYVMSKCPFGVQTENELFPVLDDFKDEINLNLNYITVENDDGSFYALHGNSEIEGNIIQLCAKEYFPNIFKDLILCMNENPGKIPKNWESCAEDLEIDKKTLKSCIDSGEGNKLLSASAKNTHSAKATASPTIKINGELYTGNRDGDSFKRHFCNFLEWDSKACDDFPVCVNELDCVKPNKIGICNNGNREDAYCEFIDPVKTILKVIKPKNCNNCDTTVVINNLKSLFPKLEIINLDYEDSAAIKLINDHNIEFAPAYVFDKSVVNTHRYKMDDNLKTAFVKSKEIYYLHPKATNSNIKFE